MDMAGFITPDEFDVVYRVVQEKLEQYDNTLTDMMHALKGNKSTYAKNQLAYFQNCVSCCKDIINHARHIIRNGGEHAERIQHVRADSGQRGSSTVGNQSSFWNDE